MLPISLASFIVKIKFFDLYYMLKNISTKRKVPSVLRALHSGAFCFLGAHFLVSLHKISSIDLTFEIKIDKIS